MRAGSARVAAAQLAVSGLCCLASPWMTQMPPWLFFAWIILWGITVVVDSPQFSTLTARNAPPAMVGSVLTFVNCIGFLISIVSIQLVVSAASWWPPERYVASPHKGSRHNRGAAVDLTLTDQDGRELPMPTPFDDFTEKAHRSYQDLPAEAKRNRARLEQAMTRTGFVGLPTEWWHFDAADWQRHPLDDVPFAALAAARPQVPPATGPAP